ncbi:formate dehydrogenase accessory protein FdhD [Nicoletella semolina]|uniref:Formate dehydrogenase accessory protein FdhD n=1 Tax=Nicoletella semolina TaxID=271160 RepID=A0A4R2N531_9PAST|nr:formate dehydrogenase accessory protein FdhD [Nicoletella semolina]
MVQKCLACSIEMLYAISATTVMAIQIARQNHFSLLAFTRQNKTTLYSGERRICLI